MIAKRNSKNCLQKNTYQGIVEPQLNKVPTQFLLTSFPLLTLQSQIQDSQVSFLLFRLCKRLPEAALFQHIKHSSGLDHSTGSCAVLLTQSFLWTKSKSWHVKLVHNRNKKVLKHNKKGKNHIPAFNKTIWSSWWSFMKPGTILANSIICWMTVVSFWAHSSHNSSWA